MLLLVLEGSWASKLYILVLMQKYVLRFTHTHTHAHVHTFLIFDMVKLVLKKVELVAGHEHKKNIYELI